MKRKSRSLPLRTDKDSKKMSATVDWAEHYNLEIYRPSPISYWIEGYMFWPNAGTIQVAGSEKKLKQRDLKGLAELLGKRAPDEPSLMRVFLDEPDAHR